MRSELKTISGKLDALTVSIQQTKDKGKLPDLKKQNATETVNWRLGKMCFFEDIVQDTRSLLLLLLISF